MRSVPDARAQVVLETEVTNKGALYLYEQLDFVRDKRLRAYYMNGVGTQLCSRLLVTQLVQGGDACCVLAVLCLVCSLFAVVWYTATAWATLCFVAFFCREPASAALPHSLRAMVQMRFASSFGCHHRQRFPRNSSERAVGMLMMRATVTSCPLPGDAHRWEPLAHDGGGRACRGVAAGRGGVSAACTRRPAVHRSVVPMCVRARCTPCTSSRVRTLRSLVTTK